MGSGPGRLRRGQGVGKSLRNGKLLEVVSRKEMQPALAYRYFRLCGLRYDGADPLHSVPVYAYFLPAQAAHVIRTSVQVA